MHTTMKRWEQLNKWDRYWDWEILWEYKSKPRPSYLCKCSCWKIKRVQKSHLINWKSTKCWSCAVKIKSTKHWFTTHTTQNRFYWIYRNIKCRCNNKNATRYYRYWWRWIKCERETFEQFKDDMYDSYLEHCKEYWIKETTIDRINNDWNYCKNNCKWATYKEQAKDNYRHKKSLLSN